MAKRRYLSLSLVVAAAPGLAWASPVDVCRDPVDNAIFNEIMAKHDRCLLEEATRPTATLTVRQEVDRIFKECSKMHVEMAEFGKTCAAPAVWRIAIDAINEADLKFVSQKVVQLRRGE